MNKKPIVARLNARTFHMSKEEKQILSQINAIIIEIEGDTDEEILSKIADADAIMIISAYMHGPVLKKMKNLKVISRLGIGVDKIDVEEATRLGIVVTNLPDFCTDEVADHTMALILSVARQVKYYENLMRNGIMPDEFKDIHPLKVQKLGIIGFGRIGKAVAKRAKSFGMKILVFDPAVSSEVAQKEGVEKVDFETILKDSDYLSLLCPLTASSREMIKLNELKKMKPTSVLINTARGELVNENDLVKALKTKIIRYAAIDVFGSINLFNKKGFSLTHPFFSLENILLTPHVSAVSEEAMTKVREGGATAVVDVLSGKTPAHIVNPEVLSKIKSDRE